VEKKQEAIRKIENDIASHKWKTDLQKKRMMDKLEKVQITLRLQKETRDYNLGTSLRNYIDPRVLKSWMNHVELDWKRVFTSTLQRKFRWVETYSNVELQQFLPEVEELGYQESESDTVIQEESLAKS
jgi:DNA topoisomerase-1